jgi:Fe2+ or Zn2+ uptake regulation protein
MVRSSPSTQAATILEVVARLGGVAPGEAVYTELRKSGDISFGEFMRLLMVLELRGLVRVTAASESRFFIHLTERAIKILTTRETTEEEGS